MKLKVKWALKRLQKTRLDCRNDGKEVEPRILVASTLIFDDESVNQQIRSVIAQ